jgi:hypothetical protein
MRKSMGKTIIYRKSEVSKGSLAGRKVELAVHYIYRDSICITVPQYHLHVEGIWLKSQPVPSILSRISHNYA